MSGWQKCHGCSRVLDQSEFLDEAGDCTTCRTREESKVDRRVRTGEPTPQAENVRRWRERTGNEYGKKYAKARAEATAVLIERHPQEWRQVMADARAKYELGPARDG